MAIPLTVVTSDVRVAAMLANTPHVKLIVPGGQCHEGAYTLLDEPGLTLLKGLRCDQFFLVSQAFDLECASDTSFELVQLKCAMIEAAASTTLLVRQQ